MPSPEVLEKRDIAFGRPWITDAEREAVAAVLRGDILTHGAECAAFEREFAAFLGEEAHAVALSSCMAGLHLACVHFGIGPGDEVIVPAQTHAATVHAVEWVGARPVFVDCDPATGNMTPQGIGRAVTPRTRAVILVHFAGIPCDMAGILQVARRHNLRVIEDCALAPGARIDGRHVGLFGDAGCFSFYPAKHMTTAEGGMLVSRHRGVAQAVAARRAFGVDRSGGYDVPILGLNYRMNEISAAIGRAQLVRMPEILSRRAANFAALRDGLRAIGGISVLDSDDPRRASSHYCLVAVLEGADVARRNAVLARLKEQGVGTSVYYPQPVPRLSYYRRRYGYEAARFPQAERISDSSFALPTGWHVSAGDVGLIVSAVRRALEKTAA
jgi:perosamine synthetase